MKEFYEFVFSGTVSKMNSTADHVDTVFYLASYALLGCRSLATQLGTHAHFDLEDCPEYLTHETSLFLLFVNLGFELGAELLHYEGSIPLGHELPISILLRYISHDLPLELSSTLTLGYTL